MAFFGYGCRNTCTSIAVVASLIIGVVTAFLRFMAVITVTPAFLWVTFGIAIVYLAILLANALFAENNAEQACIGKTINAILIGILGTVLVSVVLLAIAFAATSIIGAIITGALLFFFSLIITATACLIKQLL
ncbi:MAG: hypothetical protein IKU56_04855 [Clostridia bacterium]|nr:hypothetical protein [Clostridia bacterium]